MKENSAKTIYLIGGTTEANLAALRLRSEGYRVVVSVATALGEGVAATAGLETDAGAKDAEALASGARSNGAAAIVDCSHPFARLVSEEASRAAGQAGLPYLRHSRQPVPPPLDDIVISVDSFEAAASLLGERGGRALLTIGTRHLKPFVEAGADFTARILPLAESVEDCARLGIAPAAIIAAWPPYSADFNRACLRKSQAAVLVTKESGREGGLEEKLRAAAEEGATVILIARPVEPDAIYDLDELVARLGRVAGA